MEPREDIYRSLAWRAVRQAALARDDYRCTVHEYEDGPRCWETEKLIVHHLKPVNDGGDRFGIDNLVTVCRKHHAAWHKLLRADV